MRRRQLPYSLRSRRSTQEQTQTERRRGRPKRRHVKVGELIDEIPHDGGDENGSQGIPFSRTGLGEVVSPLATPRGEDNGGVTRETGYSNQTFVQPLSVHEPDPVGPNAQISQAAHSQSTTHQQDGWNDSTDFIRPSNPPRVTTRESDLQPHDDFPDFMSEFSWTNFPPELPPDQVDTNLADFETPLATPQPCATPMPHFSYDSNVVPTTSEGSTSGNNNLIVDIHPSWLDVLPLLVQQLENEVSNPEANQFNQTLASQSHPAPGFNHSIPHQDFGAASNVHASAPSTSLQSQGPLSYSWPPEPFSSQNVHHPTPQSVPAQVSQASNNPPFYQRNPTWPPASADSRDIGCSNITDNPMPQLAPQTTLVTSPQAFNTPPAGQPKSTKSPGMAFPKVAGIPQCSSLQAFSASSIATASSHPEPDSTSQSSSHQNSGTLQASQSLRAAKAYAFLFRCMRELNLSVVAENSPIRSTGTSALVHLEKAKKELFDSHQRFLHGCARYECDQTVAAEDVDLEDIV